MNRTFATFALAGMALAACNNKKTIAVTYPTTKTVEQTDDYFGTKVADPYRWLEDDNSDDTKAWVKAQNATTFGYLGQIPFRAGIRTQLEKLWNYEKYSAPFKAGSRYFFFKNDGLQNQSVLYVQESLEAEPKVFMDPNKLSEDGTTALADIEFSEDGKYAAYMLQMAGSDWREIRVMEVETQKDLADVVKWVKFSGISWKGDGFYYSRYDAPKAGDELKGANQFQKVFFHKVGTAQDADVLVHQDTANPNRGFGATTTKDQRFLVLSGWESTSGNTLIIKDLLKNGNLLTAIDNFSNDHTVVGNVDNTLYILTNLDAPNQRLVTVDAGNPTPDNWKTVIPETKDVLQGVTMAGGKLFANYIADAKNKVLQFDLEGKMEREVALPTIGSAGGFQGKKEDTEVFYTFSSFAFPACIYRYNIATGESTLFRQPSVAFNPEDFEAKQVFYASKDGTKVPMFIVHKKGLELHGKNPTYLYGYGGFNISLTPSFSAARMFLLQSGGILAVANLRGGGEYGEAWHEAGTKMKKQNVFDDFIAAGEYLIAQKYTSSDFLAIAGGSHGGLLVGATMTQRPDLCKVAFPAVGVLDMLRYQHFTIGRAWATDYGTSEDSKEMFDYLYRYSPVHNVKEGVEYPATMVTTADHDDRVVPAHSFKFISTLQAKYKGANPVLIRIEEKAGHGAGKPTSKQIEEWADIYAFMFYQMGIDLK